MTIDFAGVTPRSPTKKQVACAERLARVIKAWLKEVGWDDDANDINVRVIPNFQDKGNTAVDVGISGFDFTVYASIIEIEFDGFRKSLPWHTPQGLFLENWSGGTVVVFRA